MKHSFGNKVGVCSVCDINCWDTENGLPAIWPCGILGCPHETVEQQNKIGMGLSFSEMSSGLAQLLES